MNNTLTLMLTWKRHFAHRFFAMTVASLTIAGSAAHAVNETHTTATIPVYLPYNSHQFPELSRQLNAALKKAQLTQFSLKTSDYWHPYQQGLRHGRYGVYLAAPHFASWAIHKHDFSAPIRLPGKLQYVIAARQADHEFFEINDLITKSVCTEQAINLDFLLVKTTFAQSLQGANIKVVNSVASAMQYDNRNCDGFAVSEHLFKTYNKEESNRFIRLQQGQQYNNYTLLFHPEITIKDAHNLTRFFKKAEVRRLLKPFLVQLTSVPAFVRTRPGDYPKSDAVLLEQHWK